MHKISNDFEIQTLLIFDKVKILRYFFKKKQELNFLLIIFFNLYIFKILF